MSTRPRYDVCPFCSGPHRLRSHWAEAIYLAVAIGCLLLVLFAPLP